MTELTVVPTSSMPSCSVSRHTPAANWPQGGGEVGGVDRHGGQSTTRPGWDVSSALSRPTTSSSSAPGRPGENVADIVVKGGLTAVLVESELVGGECSYWACMPSKALLRGTEVLEEARAVDGARQAVTGEQDVAATLARRDAFTSNWDDSSQVQWVEGAGIELVRGAGRLAGERTVVVTTPTAASCG